MNTLYPDRSKREADRVELTEDILKQLFSTVYKQSVPELVRRTGLPYTLIYNIVHRRVKSITAREFRMIFSQDPPVQEIKKVDGAFFRRMAQLWVYLHEGTTQKDLYQELMFPRTSGKIDYRIFNGRTKTVSPELEDRMKKKFTDAGIDEFTLRQWIAEHRRLDYNERIGYARIRPTLLFLHKHLGIHPTSILNQLFERYESGELKTVSRRIYDKARNLKDQVEKMHQAQSRPVLEKLKEQVYGKKPGYTLFSEIEEELLFLRKFAGKRPTAYLGRGLNIYKKENARRIASWRARRISKDCTDFIRRHPQLAVRSLPTKYRVSIMCRLLQVLSARTADLLGQREGLVLEKRILAPAHARNEYKNVVHGFTQFDQAPSALGMNKKAFDLMVSSNCEIFREVGRYAERWYLSDLYLKELPRKPHFDLITKKYEWLARKMTRRQVVNPCMH